MIPGTGTGTAPGSLEDLMLIFEVVDSADGTGAVVKMQTASGYGERYIALICDNKIGGVFWMSEGVARTVRVAYDQNVSEHVVGYMDNGSWPDTADLDVTVGQIYFQTDKGKYVQFSWDAIIEILTTENDSGQLTGWSLTGLQRGKTGRAVAEASTEVEMDVILTTAGGDHTVQLCNGATVLATGTRTGDGAITLAEQNDSGLSGSVTIAYSADLVLGVAVLRARWASSYQIHCAAALSFPRTAETTVRDTGLGNRLTGRVGPLAAGTYDYLIRGVTDTAIAGSNVAAQGSIAIPGRPVAPGAPAYVSGDRTNTVIDFSGSTTAGATYRVYDSALGAPTDLETAAVSVSNPAAWQAAHAYILGDYVLPLTLNGYRYECTRAGTSGGSQPAWPTTVGGTVNDPNIVGAQWTCRKFQATLPVIAAAAGKRRVIIASVNGGIEDGYRKLVTIEYDAAGAVVLARPNVPGFALRSRSGRTTTIQYTYVPQAQAGVAAQVRLYLVAEGAAMGAANATAAIAAGVETAAGTLQATAPADGWYQFCVRAATAGGTLSENVTLSKAIWLSTAAPAAGPANLQADIVG